MTTQTAVLVRRLRLADLREARALELQRMHYEEIALDKKVPLDPDWQKFEALEESGSLYCYGAFVGPQLAGYSVNYLYRHLHYDILVAQNDAVFVDPAYRGLGVSACLARVMKTALRDAGAQKLVWHAKEGTALERILRSKHDVRVQDIIFSEDL